MRSLALLGLAAVFVVFSVRAAVTIVPPAGPPEVVLEAYLEALASGDCVRGRALAASTFTFGNGELCGALRVTAYGIHPGPPAMPNDHEVVFATTLTTSGGDISMPDGAHTWFYTLQRQPDGAWRIAGGGSGP